MATGIDVETLEFHKRQDGVDGKDGVDGVTHILWQWQLVCWKL